MKLIIFLLILAAIVWSVGTFGIIATAAIIAIGWFLLVVAEALYQGRS